MPTAAAAAAVDPRLCFQPRRSSAPPSPQLRRPPSDPDDWSTARRPSYFASYIPRSIYAAHRPPRLLRSSSHPVDRRRDGKEVKAPAAPEEKAAKASSCVGAIEDLGDRRELIGGEGDADVPSGGDHDRVDDPRDRKELTDAGSEVDVARNRAEDGCGSRRSELVGSPVDGPVGEELISNDRLSDQEGRVDGKDERDAGEGAGDMENGELVGVHVDGSFYREELISGSSDDGGGGGEDGRGLTRDDSILEKGEGDAESGSGLKKGELLGDQICELSVSEELIEGKENIIEENGCENVDEMANEGLVSDDMNETCDKLCSGISGMISSDVEDGSEDRSKFAGGEFVGDEIGDLCSTKGLLTGNRSKGEESGCVEHGESGSGELVCDQIDDFCTTEDPASGNRSCDMDNEDCSRECDNLMLMPDVAVHVRLSNVSSDTHSDGSGTEFSSLLAKLVSDLDSARVNLLQEMERRREVEESLAHMQMQWKTIATYFSLAGLPYPPVPMGENQQLEGNPLHICQEVIAAKFASRALRGILSRTESESSTEVLIESKNCEIAELHEKLKHYEAINHELSQRNQAAAERSQKRRQKRKTRQKLIWTCIGFSVTLGASLAAYSFLLHDASRVPLPWPSDGGPSDSS